MTFLLSFECAVVSGSQQNKHDCFVNKYHHIGRWHKGNLFASSQTIHVLLTFKQYCRMPRKCCLYSI